MSKPFENANRKSEKIKRMIINKPDCKFCVRSGGTAPEAEDLIEAVLLVGCMSGGVWVAGLAADGTSKAPNGSNIKLALELLLLAVELAVLVLLTPPLRSPKRFSRSDFVLVFWALGVVAVWCDTFDADGESPKSSRMSKLLLFVGCDGAGWSSFSLPLVVAPPSKFSRLAPPCFEGCLGEVPSTGE